MIRLSFIQISIITCQNDVLEQAVSPQYINSNYQEILLPGYLRPFVRINGREKEQTLVFIDAGAYALIAGASCHPHRFLQQLRREWIYR